MTTTTNYLDDMQACAEAIGLDVPGYVQPEDRWVHLNGIDFHYLDWGNAHLPPLVLLHGGSLTAHTWDMACLWLRQYYHCIALDQRGHGDTGWTPDDQIDQDNSDLMAADTAAFIDFLAFPRVILCGMSMGTASWSWTSRPSRCRRASWRWRRSARRRRRCATSRTSWSGP